MGNAFKQDVSIVPRYSSNYYWKLFQRKKKLYHLIISFIIYLIQTRN